MATKKQAYKRRYTYTAIDDEGNVLFEGRVEFIAEVLGFHPSHIRNCGVDRRKLKYEDGYVTIARKRREANG